MIVPVNEQYLDTPLRRQGAMDHDFYTWRDTWAESRLVWPQGTTLGVWIQLAVEWFPLDINTIHLPFLPLGAPSRPWPDTQTYTQRDYGHRVGVYRMLDALKQQGVGASVFMNARIAERYPLMLEHVLQDHLEIVAAGLDAGAIHHEGLGEEQERAMIEESLAIFAARKVQPVGWHSPSWSQSTRTPRLLHQAGVKVMADWNNDEAPYLFHTQEGPLISLPASFELSDREILFNRKQRLEDFEQSLVSAASRLAREAEQSGHGRLLTLNLSPWLMGQPYRIAAFERILQRIFAIPGARSVGVRDIITASQDL